MSDAQERTQKATEKRMKDVRSKGKLQKSTDVTAWLGVGAAALLIPATITGGTSAATSQLVAVGTVADHPTADAALQALSDGLASILPTIGGMLVAVTVAVLAGSVVQGGIHLKTQLVTFDQFNPATALSRSFGLQALWQGLKALLKTAVVGGALYLVVQGLMPVLMSSGGLTITSVLDAASSGAQSLMLTAVGSGLALAAADVFVIVKKNQKQTRMTLKEVKDENKNSDGDPRIKSQRRSRQLALSRNRMISAIATADVVLVNPTHYAVALTYEPGKSAPRLVAKGKGVIAARIREEAATRNIPMVKDVPLTRALHAACELGQEIPVEFYGAVATVLTFVAALTARGAVPGIHEMSASTVLPPAPASPSASSAPSASHRHRSLA
jgi:flagellar biosynthetic protein FlhB